MKISSAFEIVVLMNLDPTKQVILFKFNSNHTQMLSKHCLITPLLFIELKQKKGHYFRTQKG